MIQHVACSVRVN